MRVKQVSLEDRMQLMQMGLLADNSGLTAMIEKSASLPLEQFFIQESDFQKFMDLFRAKLGGVMSSPETCQDGAEAAYRLSLSEPRENTCSGLLEILKDNYELLFRKVHGIKEKNPDAEKKAEESRDIPRRLCLEERIRRADDRNPFFFPAVLLPVQQFYLGTCMLTKSYYPAGLYEDKVKALVQKTLQKEKSLTNTVGDMAMMGWVGSGTIDSDALFLYVAVIPYILIKKAKEDFEQYGE